MEDDGLFVKTDVEAATDLTTLLISVFNQDKVLQKSPLYIVAESYGGKYAVTLGLSALKAIEAGKLKAKLGGNLNPNVRIFTTFCVKKYVRNSDLICRSCFGR